MKNLQTQRLLEIALISFFALVAISFVVVYAADPSVYAQVLSQKAAVSVSSPLVMLFVIGILVLIAVLIVGVRRHWRWVFWIVLIAFGAAFLDIPITLLQLAGVLPALYPVWYSLYRMGIACIQVVIAFWMARIYVQHGTWALGRKNASAR